MEGVSWELWFAALDDPRRARWLPRALERVLRNELDVMALDRNRKMLRPQGQMKCDGVLRDLE